MSSVNPTSHPGAVHVDAAGLDRLLSLPDQLVLVDFWAGWCGPCRALAPTIDRLAARFDGDVIVAKLEIDGAPAVAGQLRIHSIPTLVLFENGQEIDRLVGALPEPAIAARLSAAVARRSAAR
ncbi:MAG: thioredoxin [Planctomycetes bacterium]|nr:thioredoxin [Planctomycetota bacterium]